MFVPERLLQRDFRVVHCHALSGAYRSIETQSLADDGFKVREGVKLLHGWSISCAGTQLGAELGLYLRVAAECEQRPGDCGAVTNRIEKCVKL